MSAFPTMTPAESAAAYERYISDNWDRLPPAEQEQARAYLQAKFQALHEPQIQPQQPTPPMYQQPGFPSATPGYGYGYGYGPGAFGPPKREEEGAWAVPVGYLGILFFTPLALYCGIYNISKGRTGHGLAQILIPVGFFLLLVMVIVSGP